MINHLPFIFQSTFLAFTAAHDIHSNVFVGIKSLKFFSFQETIIAWNLVAIHGTIGTTLTRGRGPWIANSNILIFFFLNAYRKIHLSLSFGMFYQR